MSNGPDDDYFADGLTEEIINSLAQLPDLLVTARTSAFHFKNRNIPVEEIAARLGVSHVVEGSVRRAGEQLRITAQLIRANDGFHLWSETYDRRTADTFAVQEDIAEQIAVALDVLLDDTRLKLMRSVGVRNIEAFTEYQKGREIFERAHGSTNMISGLRQANLHFEAAVELAPKFPDAYQSLNDLYTHILMSQGNGELDGNITAQDVQQAPAMLRQNFDLAIRNAWNEGQRASLQLDRELVLGNWAGLAQITDRALQLSGCNPAYWIHLASAPFGRAEALRDTFGRAVPCDPFLTRPWTHSIRASLWLREIGAAVSTGRKALETLPEDNHWVTRSLVLALAQSDRAEEARRIALHRLRAENEKQIALFMIAASEGDAATAADLQKRYLAAFGPNDYVSLMMEALRGNRNEANRLAGVIDSRPSGHLSLLQSVFWCTCGAPFDLAATPRFSDMLSESGLPWPPENPLNFPLKNW
jgi:TolB-like protein